MGSHTSSHITGRVQGQPKRLHVARINALHAGIVLACSALVSSSAFSLALGDITLSSALNEPLAASIELDSLAGAEASDISVTVGDQADYEQAGIERDPVLDSISFSVEIDNENEGRIVLSSSARVAEPFLNLIVTVAEAGGEETQKEYTLLLELPADSAVSQTATTPPAAGQAPAAPVPEPAQEVAASAAGGADSYTVGSGDTLWEIALNTRPDSGISVQQMMLAIQRANPDAFIDNNINRLIGGRVLRIPSQQDIGVIDQQSAVAQVSQQNTGLGGQPLATGNGAAAGAAPDTRDQLRVLSGDEAVDAAGGSSDLAATIAALENELMLSEENLDRARIENLELNNRMTALQEQIDLLENIIAVEDDRIATLQAELAQQAAATQQALASADTAAAAIEEINNEPASGLSGLLRNGVFILGVLVLAVLAFLAFLFQRRRQAQLAAEESRYNPALADEEELVVVDAGEKPGLLAGLLARFRRDKDEDDDDYTDEEADAIIAAQSAAAAPTATPVVAQPKKDSTDHLLDDMGLKEEMLSLDDALDGVDSSHAEDTAEVFEPLVDEASVDEYEAPVESAEQARDSDYALSAAAAAFAAIDNSPEEHKAEEDAPVEFTTTAAEAAPVDVPAEAAQDEDFGDTFEFTLKDLPEVDSTPPAASSADAIETFDFKFSAPPPAPEPERAAAAAPEALEVIAFPGAATKKETPAQDEDLSLELGDLSFDDTTLVDDDGEEESQYKPRTGNECDTKLDLATAYEAMGDVVEAIEILDEVIAEGSPTQVETAQRLKETWQASL